MIKAARPVREIGSQPFVHKRYDAPLASGSADLEEAVKGGAREDPGAQELRFPT